MIQGPQARHLIDAGPVQQVLRADSLLFAKHPIRRIAGPTWLCAQKAMQRKASAHTHLPPCCICIRRMDCDEGGCDKESAHLDVGHAVLENVQLPFEVVELDFEHPDLIQAVTVLDLSLAQSALLDLDLLVQQSKLVVSAD